MMTYDDSKLYRLYEEMQPKRRKQALKGAFRREASNVRKAAVQNLRESIRTDRDLEKGVRTVVFSKSAGFKVTVASKRASRKSPLELGMHLNRNGKKKPVLIWAEDGAPTKRNGSRKTKAYVMRGKKKIPRKRPAHSTGRMPASRFMYKTKYQVKGKVTDNIHRELVSSVERIARKYGCT